MNDPILPNHRAMPEVSRHVEDFRVKHCLTGEANLEVVLHPELITPQVMQDQIKQMHLQAELDEPIRQQQAAVLKREMSHRLRTEKIKTWKSRMKRTIAVTALMASTSSGGLIDMASDPFVNAGDVAASVIPKQNTDESFDTTEVAYSTDRAREAIVQLFTRIDKQGYDAVIHEAVEWKTKHSDLFVNAEELKRILESIDESDSNSQTLSTLSEFMSFYNINAGFALDYSGNEVIFEDRVGEVKDISLAYIKVFSSLPKDFIALSDLERISIIEEFNDPIASGDFNGSTMARYSRSNNEITVATMSKSVKYDRIAEGIITGTTSHYSVSVAHELSHAFDEHGVLSTNFDANDQLSVDADSLRLEQIGRHIIDRPRAPSEYARLDSKEFTATVAAGLFSDAGGDAGLARVDQVRQFSSESNKAMIYMLYTIEKQYPGIALLVVANRAMG